eukprot:3137160-Amphidinium_carterae.1
MEADNVTIGCNAALHADAALPPISSSDDRVVQIIPARTYTDSPRTSNCIIKPVAEQSEYMTWHDKREGTHYALDTQMPKVLPSSLWSQYIRWSKLPCRQRLSRLWLCKRPSHA